MYPDSFDGFGIPSAEEWNNPKRITFKPKPLGDCDIDVKIVACGVCGSDLHTATGGWGNKNWPIVPGHDTYGSVYADGTLAQGGYSSHIRAHEHYVYPIPEKLQTELAAPMLCAGLTAYSPLVRNGVGPGKTVGVIGIGGIGHFGILFSKALGAKTIAISRSRAKEADARQLGADDFLATKEQDWNKLYARKLDFILSTASSAEGFELGDYLSLLKVHGKFVAVGLPEGTSWQVAPQSLIWNGCLIGSSHLGNRREVLEMLQLAADKDIKSWVETISVSEKGVGEALDRLHNGDVRYRFTLVDYEKQFS
ncbi:PKS-ER domain-containing protein [Fusarium keratoplasticum]|nr:PKS-ER domain-containing protein [Fusarium keratoplasticum]